MLLILLMAAGALLETVFIMQSYRRRCVRSVIFKTLASACFVLLAMQCIRIRGTSDYARLVFWGLVCGLLGPVLSGVLTGMPSPAVLPGMMVECGVYGLVSGLMMQLVHTKKLYADLYISQITAMLLGRILSGVCKALIFAPATFTVAAWATTSFVTGLPGIVIQLVLLPTLVVALTKARLLRVRYA